MDTIKAATAWIKRYERLLWWVFVIACFAVAFVRDNNRDCPSTPSWIWVALIGGWVVLILYTIRTLRQIRRGPG